MSIRSEASHYYVSLLVFVHAAFFVQLFHAVISSPRRLFLARYGRRHRLFGTTICLNSLFNYFHLYFLYGLPVWCRNSTSSPVYLSSTDHEY